MSIIIETLLVPKMLVICTGAVIAPIISDFIKNIRVPAIVLEIIFGILIGPQIFDIVQPNQQIHAIARIGLAFLIFLAGYEIDLRLIKGKPLYLGFYSWIVSFSVAMSMAVGMAFIGFTHGTILVAIALTTTTLGVLLPVLQDAKILSTTLGSFILGTATIGEFGPIVLVTVLITKSEPWITLLFLVFFIVVAVMAAFFATKAHQPRLILFLRRHLNSSNQLSVRISVLLIFALVYLAITLELNVLLGAFTAGVVVRLFSVGDDAEIVESKLKAIGFGFLVPFFFIVSGIDFDLHALASMHAMIRVPIFLGCMLFIHAIPVFLFYRGSLKPSERRSLIFFSATGLPLIVVIASIGTAAGQMLPENAAALVGAGMLSVLLFPMLGLRR